jgi:ADP-ribose pyrophosphatase YjhB (NUDIX family)
MAAGIMLRRDAHCSYCGQAFAPGLGFPRTCAACQAITYRNPAPVVLVLLPVGDGVLVIRRGIPPHVGELALPGGYIDASESWQEAGARELFEEAGVRVDPSRIREFRVRSAPDGTVLIFGVAARTDAASLPAFQVTSETTERLVLAAPAPLAFSIHTEVVRAFFEVGVGAAQGRD